MSDKRYVQTHVHEFLGSTMIVLEENGATKVFHNHRFAGVSGQAIFEGNGHVHKLVTNTDFFEEHYHNIDVTSGRDIPVYDENNVLIGHVHGFTGVTSVDDGHNHLFKVATLIENPLGVAED